MGIQKRLNFFLQYKRQKQSESGGVDIFRVVLVVLAVALVGILAFICLSLRSDNMRLQTEKNRIDAYLSNEGVVSQLNSVDAAAAELNAASDSVSLYESVLDEYSALPSLGEAVFGAVAASLSDGVSIVSLDYAEGVLSISCVCLSTYAPEESAAALSGHTELFSSVVYKGFESGLDGSSFTLYSALIGSLADNLEAGK